MVVVAEMADLRAIAIKYSAAEIYRTATKLVIYERSKKKGMDER